MQLKDQALKAIILKMTCYHITGVFKANRIVNKIVEIAHQAETLKK